MQYFVDTIMAAEALRNVTAPLQPKMQWSGEYWAYSDRPNITNIDSVFPNMLFNRAPSGYDYYSFGPWINGLLNFPADRDAENGPIVMNLAFRNNNTDHHEQSVEYMRGLISYAGEKGAHPNMIMHLKLEEVENGFVGTLIFSGPKAYSDWNNIT